MPLPRPAETKHDQTLWHRRAHLAAGTASPGTAEPKGFRLSTKRRACEEWRPSQNHLRIDVESTAREGPLEKGTKCTTTHGNTWNPVGQPAGLQALLLQRLSQAVSLIIRDQTQNLLEAALQPAESSLDHHSFSLSNWPESEAIGEYENNVPTVSNHLE